MRRKAVVCEEGTQPWEHPGLLLSNSRKTACCEISTPASVIWNLHASGLFLKYKVSCSKTCIGLSHIRRYAENAWWCLIFQQLLPHTTCMTLNMTNVDKSMDAYVYILSQVSLSSASSSRVQIFTVGTYIHNSHTAQFPLDPIWRLSTQPHHPSVGRLIALAITNCTLPH